MEAPVPMPAELGENMPSVTSGMMLVEPSELVSYPPCPVPSCGRFGPFPGQTVWCCPSDPRNVSVSCGSSEDPVGYGYPVGNPVMPNSLEKTPPLCVFLDLEGSAGADDDGRELSMMVERPTMI